MTESLKLFCGGHFVRISQSDWCAERADHIWFMHGIFANMFPARIMPYSAHANVYPSAISIPVPIGSMYGIYAKIWGILMGSMLP